MKKNLLVFGLVLMLGMFLRVGEAKAYYYYCWNDDFTHTGCEGGPYYGKNIGPGVTIFSADQLNDKECQISGWQYCECTDSKIECESAPDKIDAFKFQEESQKKLTDYLERGVKGYCFCYSDLNKITSADRTFTISPCFEIDFKTPCQASDQNEKWGRNYSECNATGYNLKDCNTLFSIKKDEAEKKISEISKAATTGNFIPGCGINDNEIISPECRDVSIFINILLNGANYLFGIVGALALLVVVLAGIQLVISQGNPEKTKKAFDMLTAAGIGLLIVFGAYMLVRFLGSTMGLNSNLSL